MQHCSFILVAVTKIKTTEINSEGLLQLFTKFSTPENYQPYSMADLVTGYVTVLCIRALESVATIGNETF